MITRLLRMLARLPVATVLIWGSLVACHGAESAGPDSETHFLKACTTDCGGDLQCLCGVCTKPCTADTTCAALSARATCGNSCSAPSSKACDVTCAADSDCQAVGAGFQCLDQHCRVAAAGGAGGAGGTAGLGGAGGALATCQASPTPTPVLLPSAQLDPSVVARAAAVIGSCYSSDDGIGRNAVHLWSSERTVADWETRLVLQADCLANAHCGCDAVPRCIGYTLASLSGGCTPGCAGAVLTSCGPGVDPVDAYFLDPPTGFSVSIDCGAFGFDCNETAGCVAPPLIACDAATFAARCSAEGAPEFCAGSLVLHTPACSTFGLACQNGECTGDGAACANQSDSASLTGVQSIDGIACNGSALEGCFNGKTANVDCAELGPGFACQSAGGKFFCGLASECEPATETSPSTTFPDTCSGSVLSFCNAGRIEHVDCTTLGFSSCQIDIQGHRGCL